MTRTDELRALLASKTLSHAEAKKLKRELEKLEKESRKKSINQTKLF
jgi:hypothetical protein